MVARDTKNPFIVSTDSISIQVLGTEFNLKSYPNDEEVTTTLIEGSVSINENSTSPDNNSHVLKPNEQAVFTKHLANLKIHTVDNARDFAAWKDGFYYFAGESFSYIIKELERGFDVAIKIHDEELKAEKFSGEFDNGESVHTILDIMKFNRNFDYYISEDVIHIHKI